MYRRVAGAMMSSPRGLWDNNTKELTDGSSKKLQIKQEYQKHKIKN